MIPEAKKQKWIEQYLSSTISKETLSKLEEELEADPDLREWFLDYLNVDLALSQFAASGIDQVTATNVLNRRFWTLAIATCLVLFSIGWFWTTTGEPYAVVTKSVGETKLETGRRVRKKIHQLTRGILELKTLRGARVVIEAPAEFRFESAEELRIIQGRVAADVPESAHGFTILTPTGKAIDLGTRFGVDVPEQGEAEIHVFEGEVIAQLEDGDRSSLKEGDAYSLQNDGTGSNRELRSAAFITPEEMASFSTSPNPSADSVLNKLRTDPAIIALLDFEDEKDMPEGKYRLLQGRRPGSKAPEFARIGDHMSLDVGGSQTWPQITLAAWVRLDRLGAPYQSLLHTDDWKKSNPGQVHWMVTSLNTMRLALIENETEPGTVVGGYPNSNRSVLPEQGRWAHLATVYDSKDKTVRFFLNGEFDNEVTQTVAYPAKFGPARIGNWNHQDRKLSGRIDELLILGRTMSNNEIRNLFDSGNPYQTK